MQEELQDAFSVYRKYIIIKAHFLSEYDYFKYNKKIKVTEKSFQNRKDRAFFHSLAKMINGKNTIPFFISQFIDFPNAYIGNITQDIVLSSKIFDIWKKRIYNIKENYINDVQIIKQYNNWKEVFTQQNNDHSIIQKLVYNHKITPETYSLLLDLFNIKTGVTDCMLNLDYKYIKYRKFLNISKKEILSITPRYF